VSEHTAKYPIFGIAIFDNLTLPPNCSTLAEYSSTDETPIDFPHGLWWLSPSALLPQVTSQVVLSRNSIRTYHCRTFLTFQHCLKVFENVLLLTYPKDLYLIN
jgi:hypothetical protein